MQKSMASRFIDQKLADSGESCDNDFEAIGAWSADSVPVATELFRPVWRSFALLMERHQKQFENRLLTEIDQSVRITLVMPLATAWLMPLQSLLNRRSVAAMDS